MDKNEKIFTARPRIASMLVSLGYEPEIRPNIYNPNRVMWWFEATESLVTDMAECYKKLGLDVPSHLLERRHETL